MSQCNQCRQTPCACMDGDDDAIDPCRSDSADRELRRLIAQLESERDEAWRLAEWSLGTRIPSLRRMAQRAHRRIRHTSAPWLGLTVGFGAHAAITKDVGVLCFAMFTAGVLAGLFGARSNVTVAMFDEIENTEGKEP